MTTRRVQAGVPAGGRFAPTAHSESEVDLSSQQWVSIGDPDNPMSVPLYEGPASRAGDLLVPGHWDATDEDGRPVQVVVSGPAPTSDPVTLSTPMAEVDIRLASAIVEGDEQAIGELSTFAAARTVYDLNPDCAWISMSLGPDGLQPERALTAFGELCTRRGEPAHESSEGPPTPSERGVVGLSEARRYLSRLEPGDPGTRGRIARGPAYDPATYRLDVHATLGIAPF